jgi:hypothetical protein
MLPIILGTAVIGTVGYGVSKCVKDENCVDDLKDKFASGLLNTIDAIDDMIDNISSSSNSTEKSTSTSSLEQFYNLRKEILNTTYSEFKSLVKQIKDVDLKYQSKIVFNDKLPTDISYQEDISNVASALYNMLNELNYLLKYNLKDLANCISVTTDFKAYNQKSKQVISDTLVIINTINNLSNLKVVSKKDRPTKIAKKLVTETKKILDKIKKCNYL